VREVADGVWQLRGFPRDAVNVYLAGDVLIDAGTRWDRSRILRQVTRRRPRLVLLTHCHPDHQGAAAFLCDRFRIPLACHAADVPAMQGACPMLPSNGLMRLGQRWWSGPPRRVDRVLHDGDEVAGFRVVHAPGHTPGHIILFRESDRFVIGGDLLANIHFVTGRPGLREPPRIFSVDPAENRRSVRRFLALAPAVVCFGHGPPLRDRKPLEELVARLP
jgi:glyoxylase-like metal-dependent hydrolase (beta-lactamase superfamily II)